MKKLRELLIVLLVFVVTVVPIYTSAQSSNEEEEVQGEVEVFFTVDDNGNIISNIQQVNNISPYEISDTGYSYQDAKFDLRDKSSNKNVTPIKDQGSGGSCWAFATMASIESYFSFYNNKIYDFSEMHLEYMTQKNFTDGIQNQHYNRKIGDGGNYALSTTYFMNNHGPVLESTSKYIVNNGVYPSTAFSTVSNMKQVLDVNDAGVIILGSRSNSNIDMIKSLIISNGGVSASLYMAFEPPYYNYSTAALYAKEKDANHGIEIIGWDDNYSASNFATTPPGNGAWIIKNSYGTRLSSDGYNYVSYYDEHIYQNAIGLFKNFDTDFVDHTYYYDEQYINSKFVYEYSDHSKTDKVIAAEIFDVVDTDEVITEIVLGYFNFSSSTKYKVYINALNGELNGINKQENLVVSGELTKEEYPGFGYTTIKLDNPIKLKGKKFVVAVEYDGEGAPCSFVDNDQVKRSSIGEGKVFFSYNYVKWNDGMKYDDLPIPAIKVGTNKRGITTLNPSVTYTKNNGYDQYTYAVKVITNTGNVDLNDSIVDETGKDVKDLFDIDIQFDNNEVGIKVTNAKEAPAGKYKALITLNDKEYQFDIIIYKDPLVSDKYQVNFDKKFIYRIKHSTNYSQFKSNFSIYNGVLKDGEQEVKDEDKLKTGMSLQSSNGKYIIAVNGDLNGDSLCNANDVEGMKLHILNVNLLKDEKLLAADVNGDNRVNAIDVLMTKRYINELDKEL